MPETQASDALPGILAEIVESKLSALEELRKRRDELERGASSAPPPRDFVSALSRSDAVSLIAECKRRSPGAGPIRPDLDPVELARGYADAGARALSVLTDAPYFGGSNEDLRAVRAATSLPVLRKDFTLDPLHLLEARSAGADAVLLIVRILDDPTLELLHRLALELGLAVLVEVHDGSELARAVRIGARVIGINNRDLATFTTDLATTLALVGDAPDDAVIVSESGIRTPDDVRRLGEAGVDAVLVGEALLRADNPSAAAASLTGIPTAARSGTAR